MPLQNRVSPFGELCAFSARGLFMGNRDGRFHTDAKTLTARRWASPQWICCVLNFKGRRREIWGSSYTELFFLDEPTAFAAGHRPCFECRRKDAQAFAKNGAKCTSIASRHTRWRWTTCCTRNAYEDVSNACTVATSTNCPTPHLLHSVEWPSPFVATRSYTGRRMVTTLASGGRAASLSMCSPRQR
jgi:hypothetical protein